MFHFLPRILSLILGSWHVFQTNGFVVAGFGGPAARSYPLPAAMALPSSRPLSSFAVVSGSSSSSSVTSSGVQLHAVSPRPRTTTRTTPTAGSSARRRLINDPKARRRRILLARRGPHFQLDRFSGDVEFGSTADLITQLVPDNAPNPDGIAQWLNDGHGLALSIWDEKLMTDLGNSIYRLQTMKLQFVTIQLSPTVDMKMWTEIDRKTGQPQFSLQSEAFDPNIQLLPGLGVPADALKVEIEVVGELRPTTNGLGVEGVISFQTKGNLPPPMRLLPESAFQMASKTISDTIVKFAIESFQKGAIAKYRQFQRAEEQQQSQQQQQQSQLQ